jgi:capsid protein
MRRLRRLALETGDNRYLDVGVNYALPVRRFVDPIKDLAAEIMEIRAGLKTLPRHSPNAAWQDRPAAQRNRRLNAQLDAAEHWCSIPIRAG